MTYSVHEAAGVLRQDDLHESSENRLRRSISGDFEAWKRASSLNLHSCSHGRSHTPAANTKVANLDMVRDALRRGPFWRP